MKELLTLSSEIVSTEKIQQEAANVGFDFANSQDALEKVLEEANEVKKELYLNKGNMPNKLSEELGDLLFASINVARLAGLDSSKLLKNATKKFVSRFKKVEELAIEDGGFSDKTPEELDKYWNIAKAEIQEI